MSDSDDNLPLSSNDSQSTESRMRRALGLQGPLHKAPQQRADQARPRHRFVQDGGVPVVVLSGRGDADPVAPLKTRIAEREAALEAERNAHGVTRRALHEAQTSVQALQARLAHTEFAHGEALAAERRMRIGAERALQSQPAPQAAPPPPSAATIPRSTAGGQPKTARNAPRVPRTAKVLEPQPVKWWLPIHRQKTR